MLLGSKIHGVGDVKRWRINYSRWLDNTAQLTGCTVTSSSLTCTIQSSSVLGQDVIFYLQGGVVNETFTVAVQITDTLGNTKNDTISFTVVSA